MRLTSSNWTALVVLFIGVILFFSKPALAQANAVKSNRKTCLADLQRTGLTSAFFKNALQSIEKATIKDLQTGFPVIQIEGKKVRLFKNISYGTAGSVYLDDEGFAVKVYTGGSMLHELWLLDAARKSGVVETPKIIAFDEKEQSLRREYVRGFTLPQLENYMRSLNRSQLAPEEWRQIQEAVAVITAEHSRIVTQLKKLNSQFSIGFAGLVYDIENDRWVLIDPFR